MKKNSNKKIIKYLSLFTLLTLMLCGCGKQPASEKTSKADVYVPDTGYVEYSCSKELNADEIMYVQLDINPSFILGITKDYKVVSIAANNKDAEDVMLSCMGDYFSESGGGVELENAICDLAEATKQSGYIENTFDVSVTVLSGDIKESTFEQAFDLAAIELAENNDIEATLEKFTVDTKGDTDNQNDTDADNSDHHNGQDDKNDAENPQDDTHNDEDKTCDLCHGECTIVCDLCNGEGAIIETEEREVEVRNNYVCPYCGGSGMLDDGMHGGQKAVCGHCGGEGKTGPMSGDFRELAYDIEIVEEEVERTCPRCNGSGILDCPHCNGTGTIE